jgi:hypothetical protein
MDLLMHIISFMFRDNPQVMQFHYDLEGNARKEYDKLLSWNSADKVVVMGDDYGSNAVVRIDDLVGVFLTDISKEMVAHQKTRTNQLKAEMNAQREAQKSSGNIVPANPSGLKS